MDDVGRFFTGLGNTVTLLADLFAPEQMTMFVYSPGEQVHFGVMLNRNGIVAVMMDADEHRVGLDAIHDGETLEDHTDHWDTEPEGDVEMSGESASAFVAMTIKPMVDRQGATEIALYLARREAGAMAFKFENGTFWAGFDRKDAYNHAFRLPAQAGMEDEQHVIPLLDLVRDAMGEDFPDHLFDDDQEEKELEPHERPALTPQQLMRLVDPEYSADDEEPIEGAYIEIPGVEARRVQMTKGLARVLKHQEEAFREKFGREMEPSDPVFFDPEADTPQEMPAESQAKLQAMYDALNLERTREIRELSSKSAG